jgi:ABC-2 type transport system permease protein
MLYEPQDIFRYYVLVLSILSPVIIGVSVYIPFEIEKKCCNYKEMLSTSHGRKKQLISKICLISLFSLFSLVFSSSAFFIIVQYLSGYHLNVEAYLYLIFIIYVSQLIIILFHVWISLAIGRSGSIGIGICCTFLNSLLMTGLGTGIWHWFPCSWGSMLSHIFIACYQGVYLTLKEGVELINHTLYYFIIITFIAFFFLLWWFSKYEDRSL